ncbi:MAG TPA: DUF5665 domain-containing protein [Verrucomicrobiae bacterium]|nr:DUF5665 domain-containing protein [Verrucomicrobiae bacterium]
MEKKQSTKREKDDSFIEGIKKDNTRGAQRELLEELFNDIYIHRKQVYLVNFFRGISFGLGSVIGGTLILAALFWLLSQLVGLPVLGDLFRGFLEATSRARGQ